MSLIGRIEQWNDARGYGWTVGETRHDWAALLAGTSLAGIPEQNVHLHLCHLGGGFGRNGNGPQAEHAIMIANQMRGTPVEHPSEQPREVGAQIADADFPQSLESDHGRQPKMIA